MSSVRPPPASAHSLFEFKMLIRTPTKLDWDRSCRSERAHFMRLPGKLDPRRSEGALPQMGKIAADWEVGAHYVPAEIKKQRPKVRKLCAFVSGCRCKARAAALRSPSG